MKPSGEPDSTDPRQRLEAFLALNPEAEIRATDTESIVSRLWGEDAIELPLAGDTDELMDVLNVLRLPPRFVAIWHEDSNDFEVIFTVLRDNNSLLQRRFTFLYRGINYTCAFGPSSSRLLAIAERARPSGTPSNSNFRNLQQYYRFLRRTDGKDTRLIQNQIPTSFWISGIDSYEDDKVEGLVRHLNFYMSYFDQDTPTIVILDDPVTRRRPKGRRRLSVEPFPATVSGQDVDQNLLILWESALHGNPFLRFIHYYQILEYTGFYYVKAQIRREVERAITAPDTIARPDRAAQMILDAIASDRQHANEKINSMIRDCVDTRGMWEKLDGSLDDLSVEVILDGGFVLPALFNASASYEEFLQSWDRFPVELHRVRNALVHARESRQATMIAPTTANRRRLTPWLLPLSETAAQVMLYSRL